MARTKNTRPTLIYWLVDTRTNTPFYCGKTVETPRKRLAGHRAKAKLWPERATHQRIIECGKHMRIVEMETVPADGDWVAREKRWIWLLRETNPAATNVSAGGVGTPGQIPSAETRAKRAASMRNKPPISEETRARMRAAWETRAPDSAETRARKSAAMIGKKLSPERCAKLSAFHKNRAKSPEHRAKLRAAQTGKKHSDETKAKISASNQRRNFERAQHA